MRSQRRWIVQISLLLLVLAATSGTAWWFWPEPDLSAVHRQVDEAIAREDFETGRLITDRIIRRDPRNATALLQRGRVAAAQERWEEALSFFGRVGNSSRFAADARYFEGLTYLGLQRARPAEDAFLKALERNPEHSSTHEQLASLYASQLRVDAMRRHLDAILDLRTWSLEELTWFVTGGLTWGVPAQRTGQMRAYFEADPEDIAAAVTLAQVYLSNQQPDEADAVVQQLGQRFYADSRVHALMAEVALQRNDPGRAAEALSFDPADTPDLLWLARGQYAAVAGEWDDAVEYFSEAMRLDPDSIQACYRLGQAFKGAGREQPAATALERAKLLDRLNHRCMLALGAESQAELDSTLVEISDLLLQLERWIEAALAIEPVAIKAGAPPAAQQKYVDARRRSEESPRARGPTAAGLSPVTYRPVHVTNASAASEPRNAPAIVRFVDRYRETSVDFRYFTGDTGLRLLLESMGGGVATLDFDGDGWPDLFFPQGSRLPVDPSDRTYRNGLVRNKSGATFEDVTDQAGLDQPGYGIGCASGDFDNDGFQDLFVTRFGTNLLFRNNGDGTFTDVSDALGIGGQHLSSSAAFADLDRDGNLDLFVVTYLDFEACQRVCRTKQGRPVTCHPRTIAADQDILYQNHGDGSFSDVTESAGIVALEGKGLGIVVADLAGDGWPDVYIANDTTPNFLYHNRTQQSDNEPSRLQFDEVGVVSGSALCGDGTAKAGMGIACADFDGNGHLDLYVTNYLREYNTLFLNFGNLLFRDETGKASLVAPTLPVLGFGTQAIDADLRGQMHLFVTNGHVEDVRERGDPWKMPPQFFYNRGNARFTDLSRECGVYFAGEYLGRGVSRVDWDRDGKPDLVIVHQDRPVAMLHNETAAGHSVVIDLVGTASNREATNTRLIASAGGRSQVIEICGGDGYLSTNEKRQIIGIGDCAEIDDLEIRWPSGRTEHVRHLPAGSQTLIIEGKSLSTRPKPGHSNDSTDEGHGTQE
jgi:tetratricopeptide (TPR) repeat protein